MQKPRRYSKSRPRRLKDAKLNKRLYQKTIEKGDRNEERFAESLALLIERGEIFTFYPTIPFAELDSMGIDFLVYTASSRAIPFQVKSSETGRMNHYTAHGSRIRCVVVDPFITREALAARIKDEIEEMITEELARVYYKGSANDTTKKNHFTGLIRLAEVFPKD